MPTDREKVYRNMQDALEQQEMIEFDDQARAASRLLFEKGLGKFLKDDATGNHPDFDMWQDPRFAFFKRFVIGRIVAAIALEIREDSGYQNLLVLKPKLLTEATLTVCWRPKIRRECEGILKKAGEVAGHPGPLTTAACGDLTKDMSSD